MAMFCDMAAKHPPVVKEEVDTDAYVLQSENCKPAPARPVATPARASEKPVAADAQCASRVPECSDNDADEAPEDDEKPPLSKYAKEPTRQDLSLGDCCFHTSYSIHLIPFCVFKTGETLPRSQSTTYADDGSKDQTERPRSTRKRASALAGGTPEGDGRAIP